MKIKRSASLHSVKWKEVKGEYYIQAYSGNDELWVKFIDLSEEVQQILIRNGLLKWETK
jgi:hypothetical protein